MQQIKKALPSVITSLNLICGLIAIIYIMNERLTMGSLFIVLAAMADVFDGLVARALSAVSEFGKNLDSLADVVSFGVAPSMMLYQILIMAFTFRSTESTFLVEQTTFMQKLLLYSAFTPAVTGALRLARYNSSIKQFIGFVGLPIPAGAMFIISYWFLIGNTHVEQVQSILLNFYVVLGFLFMVSFLMISRISMMALQPQGKTLKDNLSVILFLLFSAAFLVGFRMQGLFLVMMMYIVFSLFTKKPIKSEV